MKHCLSVCKSTLNDLKGRELVIELCLYHRWRISQLKATAQLINRKYSRIILLALKMIIEDLYVIYTVSVLIEAFLEILQISFSPSSRAVDSENVSVYWYVCTVVSDLKEASEDIISVSWVVASGTSSVGRPVVSLHLKPVYPVGHLQIYADESTLRQHSPPFMQGSG